MNIFHLQINKEEITMFQNIFRIVGRKQRNFYCFATSIAIIIFSGACGGGGGSGGSSEAPSNSPLLGGWSGNGVAFTLNQGSLLVDNLSVTYGDQIRSGKCSGMTYTNTITNNESIEVENNSFIFQGHVSPGTTLPPFKITGKFTSTTTAEVDVSWFIYNQACDVWVEGSLVLYAYHDSVNLDDDGDSPSYVIENAYIQYRNYPNFLRNRYTAWIDVKKDRNSIENDEGLNFRIKNQSGNVIVPTTATFYPPTNAIFSNCSTTPCSQPQNFRDGGFVFEFDNISAGSYLFELETTSEQALTFPIETVDDCLKVAVNSLQKLDRLPDEFNSSAIPNFNNVFLVVELNISEIKCGYIFIKNLKDDIVLLNDGNDAYILYDYLVQKVQFENPDSLTSNIAFVDGSILKLVFEIPSQITFNSIKFNYSYGSSWNDYSSPNRDVINIAIDGKKSDIVASKAISYPGQMILPFIESLTMDSRYDNNDLILSWSNPLSAANWDKVDQLRIVLMADDYTPLVYIQVNPSVTSVTIPESIINQANNLGYGEIFWWEMQTRAHDVNNMNYARGYSN
jgi:hypothetical protein